MGMILEFTKSFDYGMNKDYDKSMFVVRCGLWE